jgi:hypothetical protein
MIRLLLLAGTLSMVSASPVLAQSSDLPARDLPSQGGAGARSGNITSTGETVPNPGVSQGAGTTPLDRGIQDRDNKIDSGICKGC